MGLHCPRPSRNENSTDMTHSRTTRLRCPTPVMSKYHRHRRFAVPNSPSETKMQRERFNWSGTLNQCDPLFVSNCRIENRSRPSLRENNLYTCWALLMATFCQLALVDQGGQLRVPIYLWWCSVTVVNFACLRPTTRVEALEPLQQPTTVASIRTRRGVCHTSHAEE